MKYQRVLYANKLTAEMQSKLRIVSFDKRRSFKRNVYFVSFASITDMKLADRIAKRLRSIALKPIHHFSSTTQREHQINICSNRESLLPPPSSLTFLFPPVNLSCLYNYRSTFITPQPSSAQRAEETLEERARRILGRCLAHDENVQSIPTVQPINFASSGADANFNNNCIIQYERNKKQLIDNVKFCLKIIEMARQAADHLCQVYKDGIDCHEELNSFFKIHSTTFYLKATTSAEIKAAFSAGLRLTWSDVADIIDLLKADICHQQLFMTQVASANYISSKVDSATSITMSSKLAYQLTKLAR